MKKKTPPELDKIVDKVLSYRPKKEKRMKNYEIEAAIFAAARKLDITAESIKVHKEEAYNQAEEAILEVIHRLEYVRTELRIKAL